MATTDRHWRAIQRFFGAKLDELREAGDVRFDQALWWVILRAERETLDDEVVMEAFSDGRELTGLRNQRTKQDDDRPALDQRIDDLENPRP